MKRRLDKLKKNIEEATAAVEQEREKNVSLLHLIFPPDIAKRLWLGKLFKRHFLNLFDQTVSVCVYYFSFAYNIRKAKQQQKPLRKRDKK